jgi:hypothetical protein
MNILTLLLSAVWSVNILKDYIQVCLACYWSGKQYFVFSKPENCAYGSMKWLEGKRIRDYCHVSDQSLTDKHFSEGGFVSVLRCFDCKP